MQNNPYDSYTSYDPELQLAARVRRPARGLIVVAVLALAMDALPAYMTAVDTYRILAHQGMAAGLPEVAPFDVAILLIIAAHSLVLLGGLHIYRFRSYRAAVAGSVAALIPLCSPLVLLGVPFGIWSLVILSKVDVRHRFRVVKSRSNLPD